MLCFVAGTAVVSRSRAEQTGGYATLSVPAVASLLGLVLAFVLLRHPHSDRAVAVPEDESPTAAPEADRARPAADRTDEPAAGA
jgi:hypothetical protein